MRRFAYFCIAAAAAATLRQGASRDLLDVVFFDRVDERKPKLGDGCRHVFLDVGSNIGVHGRMLLEPHLYPEVVEIENANAGRRQLRRGDRKRKKENASPTPPRPSVATTKTNRRERTSARKFFEAQFGPESDRDNRDFCVFAFEPNPTHTARHLEIEAAYGAMGWRYTHVHAGAADEAGEMTFYHIGKGDEGLERGFTNVQSRCNKSRRECREEIVGVVRLADWIEKEIRGRTIPPPSDEINTSKEPRVVMKMDIEMGEWLVLPDLLVSGVLCRDIDALLGEYHLRSHNGDYPVRFPQRGNWTLETFEDARVLKDQAFGMVERSPHCQTELVEGDDESYESDGMPLPTLATS